MRLIKSIFNDVLVLQSKKYNDERGSFSESFVSKSFIEHVKKDIVFCQDNITYSKKKCDKGLTLSNFAILTVKISERFKRENT